MFDPIRRRFVAATPEEGVRQFWMEKLVAELGYPKGLISVEKEASSTTLRRFDLLCYVRAEAGLSPLLLIECKAGALDPKAERQVLGYNESIGAPFMALVNRQEARTFWRERDQLSSVPFIPSYADLREKWTLGKM
jgi:hypothetical protein